MIYKNIELNFLQYKGHDFIFEDYSEAGAGSEYYKAMDKMCITTYLSAMVNFNINHVKYNYTSLFFTCNKCNYQFHSNNEREELEEMISCEEQIIKNIIE